MGTRAEHDDDATDRDNDVDKGLHWGPRVLRLN